MIDKKSIHLLALTFTMYLCTSQFNIALPQDSSSDKLVTVVPPEAKTVVTNENPAVTLWQIPSTGNIIGMGYILKTREGKIIVIDGGYRQDMPLLFGLLKQITGQENPKIDVWLLTHCHADHVAGLCWLIETKQVPPIGALYYSFPPQEWVCQRDPIGVDEARYIYKWLPQIPHIQTKANMQIPVGSVTITVLNNWSTEYLPWYNNHQDINNSSIVYRIETGKTSILFLGDLVKQAGDQLLKDQSPDKIKADVVQIAHHGQAAVDEHFYQIVNPQICLWPTPEKIWNRAQTTGKEVLWINRLGVKQQYVACRDGLVKLELP